MDIQITVLSCLFSGCADCRHRGGRQLATLQMDLLPPLFLLFSFLPFPPLTIFFPFFSPLIFLLLATGSIMITAKSVAKLSSVSWGSSYGCV